MYAQFYYKGTVCFCQASKGTVCYFIFMLIDEIQIRLREAIKTSGISQKELAKLIGINASTISKYMRLAKYPSLETFALICKAIDVSSDDILGLNR